jgi:phage terminase large subunit
MNDLVKSFTFIPGSIFENKIFIKNDPGYLGTLLSLKPEEKLRLLDGNWKISLDGLMLAEWNRIEAIFDNFPEANPGAVRAITVDAARFGRDFAVIYVWKGWEVIYAVVYKISDVHDLNSMIEKLRARHSVWKENVVVDADGVGDGVVKLGQYTAFHGGAGPMKEPDEQKRILIPYENLKAQCTYRFCEKRVNSGMIRFSLHGENVLYFDGTSENGILTATFKVNGQLKNIKELIKEDIRIFKRLETPNEGVDKKRIIKKETMKAELKRSPDFGEAAMMREFLELKPKAKEMQRQN